MTTARLYALTALALLAFAGNSLLCRAALQHSPIDAASFTTIRLISGALVLWLLVQLTRREATGRGSWPSAFALFAYAAAFSFAYLTLPAGTGALLLFGAVPASMIGWGLLKGERFRPVQHAGLVLVLALAGLVGLLLPGLSAPPLGGAADDRRRRRLGRVLTARPGCRRPHARNGRQLRAHGPDGAVALAVHPVAGAARRRRRGLCRRLRGHHFRPGLRHLVHGAARTQGHQRGHAAAQRAGSPPSAVSSGWANR